MRKLLLVLAIVAGMITTAAPAALAHHEPCPPGVGRDHCPPPPPPQPASAQLAFSCADPTVVHFTITEGSVDENFTVSVTDPGTPDQVYSTSASGNIPAGEGDTVTVTGSVSGVLATLTPPNGTCTPPTPPPAPTCEPEWSVGPWTGDPRIDITLEGPGHFQVRGGIQRSTGLTKIIVDLECGEVFEINRYKVKGGHFLRIALDHVRVLQLQAPILNH